jgi:hypothetical protein
MFRVVTLLVATWFVIGMVDGAQAVDSLKFDCTGDMIEPAGLAKAPITLTALFSPAKNVSKVSVDLGKGIINAPVLSNNPIQLKFQTKDFTGEYFYYTRDMFLVHKSGHLARLTCTPG